jgi:hopanoid biosynthesis associated radical SAM protein HpnH
MWTVATYVLRQKLAGRKRYPFVLMLEPLFRCNLACAGCGKIQYPAQILRKNLSVEKCLAAVEECGAPMVSIPGGEPLMYPEIDRLVAELVKRKKYVYLCTNAILLKEELGRFEPSKYLSFSVHMDGLREEHDEAVCRDGVYDQAVPAIRAAVARGFRVTTNSTLFGRRRGVRSSSTADGAVWRDDVPGYSYLMFLTKSTSCPAGPPSSSDILSNPRRAGFNQSPLFLRFLMGKKDFECTPWGNPTFNMFGWQRPCYLLQEGYAASFRELMDGTKWENYGKKSGNEKCRDCMVHCGYEATPSTTLQLLKGLPRQWSRSQRL